MHIVCTNLAGTMASINQLPSGKWRAQVRKSGHKPQSKTFATKSAALRWAKNLEARIELGQVSEFGESFTIESLLNKYARTITPRKKSERAELSRINGLIAALGHIDVRNLSAEEVIDYVDERLETVTSDTIRKDLGTLSHAIDTGMALWRLHMPSNPVATAKRILSVTQTLKPGHARDRRLADDEEGCLLDSNAAHVVGFALETAMRRGEIAAIKPEHRRSPDTLYIPDTKTGVARTIALTPRAAEILDLVGGSFGLKADSITQLFKRACEFYKIEDLRFHDLRHEATSRLFERGLAIQEVASITGHADWKSLKRYTHVKPSDVARKLQDT